MNPNMNVEEKGLGYIITPYKTIPIKQTKSEQYTKNSTVHQKLNRHTATETCPKSNLL